MDKQIVFYSKRYKIGYSSKDKCLYSPQTIKYEKDTEFIKKWIYYLVFVPLYPLIVPVIFLLAAYSETDFDRQFAVPTFILSYLVFGIIFIWKKRKLVNDAPIYTDTIENKKMLRDVLISNDVNYKGIIIIEIIVFGICFFCSMAYSWLVFFTALPIFIVAIFQRNIYYLFLIRKIAKQYGISLKSKDVLAENDAEAEKQINAENKANEENGTNIKNVSSTENEINAEINTAKEIVTENKATAKNETNSETNIKSDTNTNTEN